MRYLLVKPGVMLFFVLPDATVEVVRDADVEDAGFTCHDVNVVAPHGKAGPSLRSG